MSSIDWIILVLTIVFIVFYGVFKSRQTKNISGFLLADKEMPWYVVGFSVMATQASAITFLSLPGQAYSDGLRFIQFYFGLPLAMVVICHTFIPAFKRLNVYTAYEYLEQRFDGKTRYFTSILFLIQRGLSTGVAIIAPAIILSSILQIHTDYTILFIGGIVIIYTVYGGAKAVSYTQMLQMLVIFSGLIISAVTVLRLLPEGIGFTEALRVGGMAGKTKAIDLQFDWNNKYNIWSGIIGGFFLQLSYFGTDQSQVGRYLTGKSVNESRLGLVFNGLVKIPMQFLILLTGLLVFVFYQYEAPPVFFNKAESTYVRESAFGKKFSELELTYADVHEKKQQVLGALSLDASSLKGEAGRQLQGELQKLDTEAKAIRKEAIQLIQANNPKADVNDNDYVFLHFVMTHFPVGLIGLLIAVIFLASMGSTASGLNSLASTTVVDIYKKITGSHTSERKDLLVSRISTFLWGVFCVVVAFYARNIGNLIEAVNILGSFFYGTVLGIFMVAFFMKKIKGNAVFYSAIFAQVCVVLAWYFEVAAFLWLNVLGCLLVMGVSVVWQQIASED